jgi:hypothetical protein
MTEPLFGGRLTWLGSSVMTFQPASVKALFSRTALTVAHLDEIEARLRSEHHLADELLTACSMPSVQRRSPQPGRTPIVGAGVLKANRHDGPPWVPGFAERGR